MAKKAADRKADVEAAATAAAAVNAVEDPSIRRWFEVVMDGCPRLQILASSSTEAALEYMSRLRLARGEPRVVLME